MQRKIGTRKIDELGRIILPQEARTALGIKPNQNVDIYSDKDYLLLKLNNDIPICCLCGKSGILLKEIGNSLICDDCIAEIKKY